MKFLSTLHQKGFTLPELIVSVSIMTLVMTLVLFNYRKFDSNIIITDLAYDIALSIRQAQSYGVSVRGFSGGSQTGFNSPFTYSYGIHFAPGANNTKSCILFADTNADGVYTDNPDVPGEEEKVERYRLHGAYTISRICASESGLGDPRCPINSNNKKDSINIVFTRPEPDAVFKVDLADTKKWTGVTIVIRSPQKTERLIYVRSTGEITVASPPQATP